MHGFMKKINGGEYLVVPVGACLHLDWNPIPVVGRNWINCRLYGRKVSISWWVHNNCPVREEFISNFSVVLSISELYYSQIHQEKKTCKATPTKKHDEWKREQRLFWELENFTAVGSYKKKKEDSSRKWRQY